MSQDDQTVRSRPAAPSESQMDTQHGAPVPPSPLPGSERAQATAGGPPRNLANEPVLNLWAIQSDLLLGHAKEEEGLVFFQITNADAFRAFLPSVPITSSAEVFRPVGEANAILTDREPPNPRFAIGFTFTGLKKLAIPVTKLAKDGGGPSIFAQGMGQHGPAQLNDPPADEWKFGDTKDDHIDGVFIVTSKLKGEAFDAVNRKLQAPGPRKGWRAVWTQWGEVRPGDAKGHEHFGFMDGISQPGIRGRVEERFDFPLTENFDPAVPHQGLPGQDLLWPGEFVFGYPGQVAGPASPVPGVPPAFTKKGPKVEPPEPWMRDGAFLVIRRLIQNVPEMRRQVAEAAAQAGLEPEKLRAQLVGRWPSGAPILHKRAAQEDYTAIGANDTINNDFEFGDASPTIPDDRTAQICPWAAHVRKTYPRDDVRHNVNPDEAAVDAAEAFIQTRRMLRRGIQFGPELTPGEINDDRTHLERGLIFKCYVTSLKEQFEFVQQAWCNADDFSQPGSGLDVIIGQAPKGGARSFTGIPDASGVRPTFSFEPWVVMTGGEYFFAPSLDFLREQGMQKDVRE